MRFDIQAFVDRQRVSRVHLAVLAVCTFVMFIDGFDIFMVGRIAPAIADGFHQPVAALTPVFLYQQIGLMIGAFAMGPLADRLGRRRLLIYCSLVFGLLTLACVLAENLFQLAVLRGVSGIFLSGGVPVAMALLAEMAPAARRSTFLTISLVGFSAGAAFGSAVAAWLIDSHGWQSGFWLGGILPLVSIPLLWLAVPESIQFRVARDPADPAIPRTLLRLDPTLALTGQEQFAVGDGSRRAATASPLNIFRDGRARTTILLWLAATLSMSTTALLAAWLPTFFREMAGISIQRFAIASLISFGGGVLGTLTIGYLLDRVRASRLIPLFYLGMAATMVGLGAVPFGTSLFVLIYVVSAFCQVGGQSGINAYTAQLYPASMRSTGFGWSGGAGRIASLAAPGLGALALTSHLTLAQTMTLIALPPLGVAIVIFLIGSQRQDAPALTRAPA